MFWSLQHLVSGGDRLRVGFEGALMSDEVDELLSDVDVRPSKARPRPHRDRRAGGAEGSVPLSRVSIHMLLPRERGTRGLELRDGELPDGELLAVGIHAAHDARAVNADARQAAGRIAVLLLARDVRGTRNCVMPSRPVPATPPTAGVIALPKSAVIACAAAPVKVTAMAGGFGVRDWSAPDVVNVIVPVPIWV